VTVSVGKRKQQWPPLPFIVCCVFAAVVTVGVLGVRAQRALAQQTPSAMGQEAEEAVGDETTHLYFADRNARFLSGEQRVFPPPSHAAERIRQIVEALIHGPTGSLLPTVPESATLRSVFLLDGGTAVVDLDGSIRKAHWGGVHAERLTVYAIVNSITLNMESVETVRILIDGGEATTLAGHWDIRKPLRADLLLIRCKKLPSSA